MSQLYECWDKEEPDNVQRVETGTAATAAEIHAERIWDPLDNNTGFEIDVRDSFGKVSSFIVDVRMVPTFDAVPVRSA